MVYGIIYKVTGPSGKVYIGQTTEGLKIRKRTHKYRSIVKDVRTTFQEALLTEGFDNFTWEQIDNAENYDELQQKEIYWIAFYKSTDPKYGYNISKGGPGAGFSKSEETKSKISKKLKGRDNYWCRGRKWTPEQIEKARQSQKGKYFSEETRRKLSEAHKGKRHHVTITEELARQMKYEFQNGMRICEVQHKYNVTRKIAADIKYGLSWGWLKIS